MAFEQFGEELLGHTAKAIESKARGLAINLADPTQSGLAVPADQD